jgi:trimethylamine:corrinoid methyltransferase-like protein
MNVVEKGIWRKRKVINEDMNREGNKERERRGRRRTKGRIKRRKRRPQPINSLRLQIF